MSAIVELPSDELVEAGRTSEILGAKVLLANGALGDWLIRSEASPPPVVVALDLPPAQVAPRHPYLAIILLFFAMAICVPIAAIAGVLALEDHRRPPVPTAVAAPRPSAKSTTTTVATSVVATAQVVEPQAIDVNDLPRARKKIGQR